MQNISQQLSVYSKTLMNALMQLKSTSERDMIVDHLSNAATMKRMIWDNKPLSEIKALALKENQNHCCHYIHSEAAEGISQSWNKLLKLLELDEVDS